MIFRISTMTVCRLLFFLVALSFTTAQAQDTPKKKKQKKEKQKQETTSEQRELKLDKQYPVYVTGNAGKIPSPCPVDLLIRSLRDSLRKEGYKIMDSAQLHQSNQLVIKDILKYSEQDLSKEAGTAQIKSRILRQTLRVQNMSCLEDEQKYSVFIYTSPKGGMKEGVNKTFYLPKDSPTRIIDIVLALIRRE